MGNPFQDKFLKAGLVNKNQVTKVKREQRIIAKQNKNVKHIEPGPGIIEQEQAARKLRIKELNRQQNEEKRQQELLAQARQLIENNRLPKDNRGEAYNFVEGTRIKRIYVSDEIADQISRGRAAIVKFGPGYEVVPARVAQQIANRVPDAVLVLLDGEYGGEIDD